MYVNNHYFYENHKNTQTYPVGGIYEFEMCHLVVHNVTIMNEGVE